MDCICSYIVANANALIQALQNRSRDTFCDNSGCYEDVNQLFRTPAATQNPNNFSALPLVLMGAIIMLLVLSFMTNRQKKKVSGLDEKPNNENINSRDGRRDDGLF